MSPTTPHHPVTSLPGPTVYANSTDRLDWKQDDDVMGYESAFPRLTIHADALASEKSSILVLGR